MTAFLIALFFVCVAEMGDKTQLVALAFATRYRASVVLWGVFLATLFVHLFSVAIGELLGLALPTFCINVAAGVAFVGFGLWTLRGDSHDDDESKRSKLGPLATVAITFFLAELGDKTMLATVTIASQQHSFLGVWLGSTLGMVIADGLAVYVGKVLHKRLPERAIQVGSAAVFVLSGLFTLGAALLSRA